VTPPTPRRSATCAWTCTGGGSSRSPRTTTAGTRARRRTCWLSASRRARSAPAEPVSSRIACDFHFCGDCRWTSSSFSLSSERLHHPDAPLSHLTPSSPAERRISETSPARARAGRHRLLPQLRRHHAAQLARLGGPRGLLPCREPAHHGAPPRAPPAPGDRARLRGGGGVDEAGYSLRIRSDEEGALLFVLVKPGQTLSSLVNPLTARRRAARRTRTRSR